jgi:phosphoribosylglycinamide formyltransferase-1
MSRISEGKRIGFLCSGNGHIFRKTCEAMKKGILNSEVVVCIVDRPCGSEILTRSLGIPLIRVFRRDYKDRVVFSNAILEQIIRFRVDAVGLTFDSLLEGPLLEMYGNKMMNVHPALLPAFPGLNAVKKAKDSHALYGGATIHLVDGKMDHGPIVSQGIVPIHPEKSPQSYDDQIFQMCYMQLIQALKWFEEDRIKIGEKRVIIQDGHYGGLPFSPALEIPSLLKPMNGWNP